MSGQPIQMSTEQFKAYIEATGNKVQEQQEKGEVEVRLVIYRDSRMRWGHVLLLAWFAIAVLLGNWYSLPALICGLVALWDIRHTATGIEELLAGLNQAGLIDTDTKMTGRQMRDAARSKRKEQN